MRNKKILQHDELYVSVYTKDVGLPYVLFVHGGPGLNVGALEYLIDHEGLFLSLDANIIFYDQRGCGRSLQLNNQVVHQSNIDDLASLHSDLSERYGYSVVAIIGHSYGAKLLYDTHLQNNISVPLVLVATSNSILTPRINNMILDLSYLKSNDRDKYNMVMEALDRNRMDSLWEVAELLSPMFHENPFRPLRYWANLTWYEKYKSALEEVKLPINNEIFMNVRKSLYTNNRNCSIDIDNMTTPYLWINGVHDYVMNGALSVEEDNTITPFYHSAHYPHIEENKNFCGMLNEFFLTL